MPVNKPIPISEIIPHKPVGATHVWTGLYYKYSKGKWFRWSDTRGWVVSNITEETKSSFYFRKLR